MAEDRRPASLALVVAFLLLPVGLLPIGAWGPDSAESGSVGMPFVTDGSENMSLAGPAPAHDAHCVSVPQTVSNDSSLGVPLPTAPRDGWVVNLQPRFNWTEVQGASAYDMAVGADSSVNLSDPLTVMFHGIDAPPYVAPLPITPGETYFWKVRACDGLTKGEWSSVSSFLVAAYSDFGDLSSARLTDGTGDFGGIGPGQHSVVTAPGEHLSGNVTVQAFNAWGHTDVVPLVYATSWGLPWASFRLAVYSLPTGSSSYAVNLSSLVVPEVPGTYHVLFAFRAETSAPCVASATNWATGLPNWTDGNEIALLNESEVSMCQLNGRCAVAWLQTTGYAILYLPCDALDIVVRDPSADAISLGAASLTPGTGKAGVTSFTFSVEYRDFAGALPDLSEVVVDGVAYPLERTSGSPAEGLTFFKWVTLNSTGDHSYYFRFARGAENARLPEAGTFSGPEVVPGHAPPAPVGLGAVSRNGAVTISWMRGEGLSQGDIAGFRMYRATVAGLETYLGYVGGGTQNAFEDNSVAPGQTYHYQVSAVTVASLESERSDELSATVPGVPRAPVNLTLQLSAGQATLRWSPPRSDGGMGITGYYVVRGLSLDARYVVKALDARTFVFNDTAVVPGATYYYWVQAMNEVGPGALPMPLAAQFAPLSPGTASAGIDLADIAVVGAVAGVAAGSATFYIFVAGERRRAMATAARNRRRSNQGRAPGPQRTMQGGAIADLRSRRRGPGGVK